MKRSILLISLAVLLFGCKSVKPYTVDASGESVAKSTAFIAAASANIDAAKPDSGPTGKKLLDVANDQLSNATNENVSASKQIYEAKWELARVTDIARDFDRSWFGGKFRRLAWWTKLLCWIIGIAAVIYAVSQQNIFTLPSMLIRVVTTFVKTIVWIVKLPFTWFKVSVKKPKGRK